MSIHILSAVLIPFLGTTLGAACVFLLKGKMNRNLQRALSGFAAGVMVAASIWSLIIPAMDQSAHLGKLAFLPALIGVWGGVLFLLLSGVCATLGSRSFRRGLIVYGCGLLCTAVTAGMVVLGFASESIIVRFGVLHCLGLCMILWSLLRRLPTWILALLGSLMVITGLLICDTVVKVTWLYPLGLTAANFFSSDYFPLLPHLGFFLLGSVLGRALYRNKQSLLPGADQKNPVIRFLCFCGRQSLPIYLLHQPVLTAVCEIITLLK